MRAFALLLISSLICHAGTLKVTVDTSQAPECGEFAEKAQTIAVEWYPKIHALLFDEATKPAPDREIKLIFRPMSGVAHATRNEIHVSSAWIKKSPQDYGMIVHELVHLVQAYKGKGEFWITEGIADYIRYFHYEPGKNKWSVDRSPDGYKRGYGISAAFLDWVVRSKPDGAAILRKLNTACHEGTYNPEFWQEQFSATPDELWKQYLESLKAPGK